MYYQLDKWQHSEWNKNTRYYGIDLCQDLFGQWVVKRTWGKDHTIGAGQSRTDICQNYYEALSLYEKQRCRRQKRGYQQSC